MPYTDDPIRDWADYCAQQEREMELLPECSECGEKITDDMCFVFGDEPICDSCAYTIYRKHTTDFAR